VGAAAKLISSVIRYLQFCPLSTECVEDPMAREASRSALLPKSGPRTDACAYPSSPMPWASPCGTG